MLHLRNFVSLGILGALLAACTANSPGPNAGDTADNASSGGTNAGLSSRAPADTTVGSLKYTATAAVHGDSLMLSVSATNVGEDSVHAEWGACWLDPQLYRADGESARPAFDWENRPNPDPSTGVQRACPMYLAIGEVPSGESLSPKEFHLTVPSAVVLGDSLPPGAYDVVVKLSPVTRDTGATQSQPIRLSAGTVTLGR